MRKRFFALLLAALLVGCGAPAAPDRVSAPAAAPSGPETAAAPEVYFLNNMTPCIGDSASAEGKCYYFPVSTWEYEKGNYIVELDGATGKAEPLCHDASCTHMDESCPAFFPMNLGGRESVYLLGDQLLVLLSGSAAQDGDIGFLMLCDTDGNNRREVCRLDVNEAFTGGVATDGEAVYTMLRHDDRNTLELVRIGLTTGERQVLHSWDTAVPEDADTYVFVFRRDANLLAAAGRSLYLRGNEMACVPYPEDDETISMGQSAPPNTLYRYDLDAGTLTPVLTGKSGETYGLTLGADMYQIRETDLALVCTHLETGEVEVLRAPYTDRPLPMPKEPNGTENGVEFYAGVPGILGYLDGRLLIENAIPGETSYECYAVDPVTGKEAELPLRAVSHWRSQPLYVGGRCGDRLLVRLDENYVPITVQGPDGGTDTFDTAIAQWALITIDDYCAGNPNYLLLDGPGPF